MSAYVTSLVVAVLVWALFLQECARPGARAVFREYKFTFVLNLTPLIMAFRAMTKAAREFDRQMENAMRTMSHQMIDDLDEWRGKHSTTVENPEDDD